MNQFIKPTQSNLFSLFEQFDYDLFEPSECSPLSNYHTYDFAALSTTYTEISLAQEVNQITEIEDSTLQQGTKTGNMTSAPRISQKNSELSLSTLPVSESTQEDQKCDFTQKKLGETRFSSPAKTLSSGKKMKKDLVHKTILRLMKQYFQSFTKPRYSRNFSSAITKILSQVFGDLSQAENEKLSIIVGLLINRNYFEKVTNDTFLHNEDLQDFKNSTRRILESVINHYTQTKFRELVEIPEFMKVFEKFQGMTASKGITWLKGAKPKTRSQEAQILQTIQVIGSI